MVVQTGEIKPGCATSAGFACLPARFGFCCRLADAMNRYEFHLRITTDQYLDYYRGTARSVVVRCTTGTGNLNRMNLPALHLLIGPPVAIVHPSTT
jgi:hypothetical protein